MPYTTYWESKETGVILLSLKPGHLLLESLRQVARDANIHTGVVIPALAA